MGTPQPKTGDLVSEVFLAFTRSRPCAMCGAEPPSDPHHYPPVGRGVRDDSSVAPLCRQCHQDAQAYKIESGRQHLMVAGNQIEFMRRASHEQWDRFGKDRAGRMLGSVPW